MRRARGLTLVEMLVVVAVCGILALLLLPVCLNARGNARTVVCAQKLKALGQTYALNLTQTGGALPDAYYSFMGSKGTYRVAMLTPETDEPDRLLPGNVSDALICPADDRPVGVLARNAAIVPSSYAYNVGLPLMYRNLSRVAEPVNTVTFYDGDATAVVGTWEYNADWADKTVRPRHARHGNFLYLDGHVEREGNFPSATFGGGEQWLASSLEVPVTVRITGRISNLNPSNSASNDFSLKLPDGFVITRSDLLAGTPITHNAYFHPDHLEYDGPAAVLTVRLKRGSQNFLTIDGQQYQLKTDVTYTFTSPRMTVHLGNTDYSGGKVMGDWWLEISASRATMIEN